jgi:hypothetical protein
VHNPLAQVAIETIPEPSFCAGSECSAGYLQTPAMLQAGEHGQAC